MNDRIFPCLYHGSNDRAFFLKETEREEIRSLCKSTGNLCYLYFKNKNIFGTSRNQQDADEFIKLHGPKMYNEIRSAFQHFENWINGSKLYQYDCLYLTNGFDRAKWYAEKGTFFGESGNLSRTLLHGALAFDNWHDSLNDDQKQQVQRFLAVSESKGKPVIVKYFDVPMDYLLSESGKPLPIETIDGYDGTVISFRVKRDADLSLIRSEIIYL